MDAYEQYMNLFGSFNFTWIIISVIAVIVLMVFVAIIKFKINMAIIKKSVKDAIRELNAEEQKKALENDNKNNIDNTNNTTIQ
jgi:uncharacterized membrane protein